MPVSAIQTSLAANYHHPPLYFYLLHFILAWFGPNAWALRLISAAAGALTVGLVFYWCSAKFGLRAGIVAAALCLVAPFHLAYSQEGRPYALAALFALVSCCALPALLGKRTARSTLLYAGSSIALLYTHHWGMFVLSAQAIYVALERDVAPGAKRHLLVCWLVIAGLYLPELPALLDQSSGGTSAGWFWVEHPGWGELYRLAGAFSGTYFRMASSTFELQPITRIAGSVAAIVAVGGMVAALIYGGSRDLRAVVVCFGGILLVPLLISYARPEVFLWYRYTVVAFPLFCIALGAISRHRPWGNWGLITAGILIVTGSLGSARYYSWAKSNVRDVASYADSLTRSGANILIRPQSFAPQLNYYYRGGAVQYDEAYLDRPLGEIVDTASSFIYVSLDVPNGIRGYMDGHFQKVAERRFPGEAHMGMVVTLYRQPPDESGE